MSVEKINIGEVSLGEFTVDDVWYHMMTGMADPEEMKLFCQKLLGAVFGKGNYVEISLVDDASEILVTTLKDLPSEERRGIIIALYFADITPAELARRMNVTPATIYRKKKTILRQLRLPVYQFTSLHAEN